ncbi:hypothetical protein [Thauera chlorobenzoica]|uniref:Uncharacterized protein n=1 Tax=Thauera chlorobenzoica TaxID=96773 RepID=A0A1H5SE03_9RHOO|nr:hypothetical protein [Thauera chlorobenzoica]APR04846.1 hypothetical protein Tchl_1999 [Thauera chlorobenzoica]SEF48812.1 hypothetical protein SAMN05216242_101475 [Thauera chlorobenzoica]
MGGRTIGIVLTREVCEIDPVERYPDQWRRHMRAWKAEDHLGYPSRSVAFRSGGSRGEVAFEDMCEGVDNLAGYAMEAIVDDLEPMERAALSSYYLGTRFPGRDLHPFLVRAKQKIRRKLPSRGLV